jgi:hypothetical protein
MNTTTFSRDPTRLPGRSLRLRSPGDRGCFSPSASRRGPVAPDVIQPQDHEAHQRLPPPPLVPHLLQRPDHPVGPLHMVVRPHPPAHRVVQVGHDLGELLRPQLLQRLDQLRHGREGRIPHDRREAAARLVIILGRVEEPVDPVGEAPQGRQLGQVTDRRAKTVKLPDG